jgi:hypothetical protein
VGALWQAVAGAYLAALGSVSELCLKNTAALASVVLGILISVLLLLSCKDNKANSEVRVGGVSSALLTLLAVLFVGVLPICLMDRVPFPGNATRYFLPLAPYSSVIFVYLLSVVFNRRLWFMPALVVGLACGSAVTFTTYKAVKQRRAFSRYGDVLLPEAAASSELLIAVLPVDAPDYEMTGSITKNWPPAIARKFWAVSGTHSGSIFGPRSSCENREFARDIRHVSRSSTSARIVLITDAGNIEPYCLGE